MKKKMSKKEKEFFNERFKKYENARRETAALYQSIFTGLLATAIAILLDILSPVDLYLKLFILLMILLIAYQYYKRAFIQTQKPVFAAYNIIGTMENKEIVKGEDGKEWVVAQISGMVEDVKLKKK